jgi:excisionase family DNA binding protein
MAAGCRAVKAYAHAWRFAVGDSKFGTIQDAADLYGVSTKTVRRWIAEGRLDGYRVGDRLIRVDLTSNAGLVVPMPTAKAV